MIFEYYGKKFQGTRAEIQDSLKVEINCMSLTWDNGSWHLGSDSLQCDCCPTQAKWNLTKQIVENVPLSRTARIDGSDVIITNYRGKTRRISIYDI